MTPEQEGLKPCPFCGGICSREIGYDEIVSPVESDNGDEAGDTIANYQVVTGCLGGGPIADTAEEAQRLWNTRPLESALLARAEKAEGERDALLKAQRWQPIETAPKNGMFREGQVLITDGQFVKEACYLRKAYPHDDQHGWCCSWGTFDKPTHWMPLPAPDSLAGRGEGL